MRRPRLGEVRIVTDLGEGDQIVTVYELTRTLRKVTSDPDSSGIVELSAPSAKPIRLDRNGEEDCPDCPIQISKSVDQQKVVITARTHILPPEHIGCVANQLTSNAGIMLSLTPGDQVATASSNLSRDNT